MSEIVIRSADPVDVVDAEIVPADVDRHLSPAAVAAVAAGRAASTARAYRADRERFADWCATEGRTPLPATAETLTEYAAHLVATPLPRTGRTPGPATVERALAAISTLHEEHGLPKPVLKGARAVVNGYKDQLARTKAPQATPRKAAAAVPEKLRAMLAGVDRSTLVGKRDAAMVLLGFAAAARVSELVAVDVDDLVPTEHGFDITIYRQKVKKHTTTAILYGTDPATCPVRALQAYLAALAAAGRTTGPLCVRVDRHGRIAPPMTRRNAKTGVVEPIGDPAGRMTPAAAGQVVARLADAAGLEGDWSGHSLRRGFATAARLAGHDMLRIGRGGGWADGSKALAGYMDDVDRVTGSPLVGIGL